MNLKEAIRYQKKLQNLIDEAEMILRNPAVTTSVKDTYLHSRIISGTDDETFFVRPEMEYSGEVDQMVEFVLYLLGQAELLEKKIYDAKAALPIDFDVEADTNVQRLSIANTLTYMDGLRNAEELLRGGGTGYRMNGYGQQVAYKCDVKRVTTINFNRTLVREKISELYKKADTVSAQMDRCIVNTKVDFEPPFDVNDSFSSVFTLYCEAAGK